jgi:hypothetical protein
MRRAGLSRRITRLMAGEEARLVGLRDSGAMP